MENDKKDFAFPTEPDTICDTIFNTQTYFSRCVGYCTFHKGYLTAHQLKLKQCLSKNCDSFIKREEHQYWKEVERKKTEKELRKAKQKLENEVFENNRHTLVGKKSPPQKKKRYICLDLEMCELTSKQRKSVKGMAGEVIQIGAVMLDENLKYLSEFSSFVKPVYGQISEEISNLTGITDETVQNADTFTTAFYKFFCWAGNDDITTFCWSDSDYKQLWDEIYIKAKGHDEYRDFLRTFVDLQAIFDRKLGAEQSVSLDKALKFCNLKFKGQRHSALFDSFNTARVLYKMYRNGQLEDGWNYIASYSETDISKKYFKVNSFDKDYTSSFASFISPELLEKFGHANENPEEENEKHEEKISVVKRFDNILTPFFSCANYGISFSAWLKFTVRMKFTRDLKLPKLVEKNVG